VLGLIGFLLWRRTRGALATPPAGQQPFFGQQTSFEPITPSSLRFSTNSNYMGGPPVTHAVQPGWHPQQSSLLTLPGAGFPVAGQASTTSQQPSSPPQAVSTWIERPLTTHQEMYGRPVSQPPSSPTEDSVDPRELYSEAFRGPTYSAADPMNVPSSVSGAGSVPPHAPAYSPVSEKAGSFGQV